MATVRNPPPREETAAYLAARKAGEEPKAAARAFGNPRWRHRDYRLIEADPERFDPIDDEVAVERALHGDRKVFERLTHYEYGRVWDHLWPIWVDLPHGAGPHSKLVPLPQSIARCIYGWGVPAKWFSEEGMRHAEARAKAAR